MTEFARGGIVAVPPGGSDEVPLFLDRGYVVPAAVADGLRLYCPRCLADGHVCEVQDDPGEPPEPVPALVRGGT